MMSYHKLGSKSSDRALVAVAMFYCNQNSRIFRLLYFSSTRKVDWTSHEHALFLLLCFSATVQVKILLFLHLQVMEKRIKRFTMCILLIFFSDTKSRFFLRRPKSGPSALLISEWQKIGWNLLTTMHSILSCFLDMGKVILLKLRGWKMAVRFFGCQQTVNVLVMTTAFFLVMGYRNTKIDKVYQKDVLKNSDIFIKSVVVYNNIFSLHFFSALIYIL